MKYESSCCPPYGGPEVLKFEEYPDPIPGPGEGGSGKILLVA
jgi:hypothetical protein